MQLQTDFRLLRLSNVIRTAISEMLSDRMALKFQQKKITSTEFSKRLFEILEVALKCDREQYITELTEKLQKMTNERDEALRQLQKEKRLRAQESTIMESDNAALQKKYDALDGHYKSLGWRKDQKEISYQEQIQLRDNTIRIMRKALTLSLSSTRQLRNELDDIKGTVKRMVKGSIRLLRNAKPGIADRANARVIKEVNKQKKRDSLQLSSLAAELKSERMAHDQLKGASQLLLDSVWNISPRRKGTPKVSIDELPRKIADVHSFMAASVEDQKSVAVEEVKRELSAAMPEMTLVGDESVSDAVSLAISERVAEKEAEMAAKIKTVEKREQKLRKKLELALSQIQTMKKATPRIHKSTRSFTVMDALDDMKDDWERQSRQLDMKMSELSRGMSVTSP